MYIDHSLNSSLSSTERVGNDLAFYQRLLKRDLEFLESFVAISSQSKNAQGVYEAQKFLARELQELGFEIKWVTPNEGIEGAPLLHAVKKGLSEKGIAFVGHADTVLGPGGHFPLRYEEESLRLIGPGVADDKGGLCVALRGIREYLKQRPHHFYTLHFISSPNEEVGSLGVHSFYRKMGVECDYVLGFEPALSDGSLVSSRNGNIWYRLKVKGKSAHAGRFGEVSINAAHELSRIVMNLHLLNDIENKTKVNVGSISGGTGHFNVVCGEAQALIDMRFPSELVRKKLHERFCELIETPEVCCFETGTKAIVQYEIEDNCPALAYSKAGGELADLFKESICALEGRQIVDQHTGGAADVNYLTTPHNAVLDGLGPVGGGLHTIHEYVELPTLYTRSEALREVLDKLNRP